MKVQLCLLLIFLQLASSRPVFERDVHAAADEDGFFRSRSLKRSQGVYALEYTAKIAKGVISLDKDQAIEEIRCNGNEIHIKTTEPRLFKEGDLLAGGAEWGCQNAEGESITIAFRVAKAHRAGGIYRISGSVVPGESLFEHLDLTFERAEENQLISRQAAAITFPNFPSTIVPGKSTRVSFTIDTTRISGDQDISVAWIQRQNATVITASTVIATVKGNVGSFDWTAPNVANPAVPSFFQLTQGMNMVESPAFFIEKTLAVVTWNTNADKTSKVPDMVIWNSTCLTAAYCKEANNCPSCAYPNRASYLFFKCRNCTASFSPIVHKFSIKTSPSDVTNFTFSATVDFASSIDWEFDSNFEWSGKIKERVFSTNLLAIAPFTVGELSVNLNLFLDIDIAADVRAPKANLNGSIFTRTGASYDIDYDGASPVKVTIRPFYKRPHSPLYGDAPYLAWFNFIPTVRLAVQNNVRALAVAIDQYLYADYRFANPLPPMKTEFPLPNGDWKWSADICKEPHRQEQWEWTGTDYNAEVTLGAQLNTSVKFPMHDFASGCDWLIELGDHIYITPTAAGVASVQGPVFVEVRKEVGICLGMTDANLFIEKKEGNEYRISFLSNEHGWSDKLAAQFGDKSSMVYKQPLLKDASWRVEKSSSEFVLPSLLIVLIMLMF